MKKLSTFVIATVVIALAIILANVSPPSQSPPERDSRAEVLRTASSYSAKPSTSVNPSDRGDALQATTTASPNLQGIRSDQARTNISPENASLWAAVAEARFGVYELSAAHAAMPRNEGVRFFAGNPTQDLTARFRDGAMQLESGTQGRDWMLVMGLQFDGTSPQRTNNSRIEYVRGDIVEWFENRAAGIEHGFVIEAPIGTDPLELEVRIDGDLHAESDPNSPGDLRFVNTDGKPVVGYQKLRAWDAAGIELQASMRPSETGLVIAVNDTKAQYPVTIDPLLVNFEKQLDPVTESGSFFGFSKGYFGRTISISGNTAVVGGTDTAFVLTRSAGTWSVQARLEPSDPGSGSEFGFSVDIDGTTIVVGAPSQRSTTGEPIGAAYVYSLINGVWSQQAKLEASDGASRDGIGESVSISGDTAIVGASTGDRSPFDPDTGAVYVFVRSGTAWSQATKIIAPDAAAGDEFGAAVTIDGNTAAIGAPSSGSRGSTYVFLREAGSWGFEQKLDLETGQRFGASVALSENTLVVGAPGAEAAHVYTRSLGVWTEEQVLDVNSPGRDFFGTTVAISGDRIAIGAPGTDLNASSRTGRAYIFVRSAGVWNEQQMISPMNTIEDGAFGNAIAIDADRILVGASKESNETGFQAGSIYAFEQDAGRWNESQNLRLADSGSGAHFGTSVSIELNTALVGAPLDDTAAGPEQGTVFVFTRSA